LVAVELALMLPVLVALRLGTVDYGRFAKTAVCVNNAAGVGAYNGSSSSNAASDTTAIRAAVVQDLQGLEGIASADITVTSSTANDSQGNPMVKVTVSVPFRTLCSFPVSVLTIAHTCQMRIRPV
jgi:Flp pilus assembly protein TadG